MELTYASCLVLAAVRPVSAADPSRPLVGPGHTWLRFLIAFVLLVAALAAIRFEIIDSPPYFDFAMGIFTEANYLVESNFDYYRLRYVEADGLEGGPRAYLTSVVPTLVALNMMAAPSSKVMLVVCHLFSFACAAATVLAVYALLAPSTGRLRASAVSLAMLTTPIFSTQVDMLGIDLPMAAFATLAVLALCRERYVLAALLGAGAFFMKPTGIIATATVTGYLLLRLLALARQSPLGGPKALMRPTVGLLANLAALGLEVLVYRLGNVHERLLAISAVPRMGTYIDRLVMDCPDQLPVFLVCLAASFMIVGRWWLNGLPTRKEGRVTARLSAQLVDGILSYPLPIVSWAVLVATPLAIAYYSGSYLVRYLTLVVPFLYIIFGLVFFTRPWRWPLVVAVALVSLNIANWNGRFFPEHMRFRRHCGGLERSHEYLPYHRSTIQAIKRLEMGFRDEPIITAHPYTYYLALPRLGYVERPLHGYCINRYAGPHFVDVADLVADQPRDVIFLSEDNACFACGEITVPPPGTQDELIWNDQLPAPLVIYRKRLEDVAATRPERDKWLVDHLWFDPTLDASLPMTLAERASLLAKHGRADLGIDLLSEILAKTPGDRLARSLLGRILRSQGYNDEAAKQFQMLLTDNPADSQALFDLGLVRAVQGRFADAQTLFEGALRGSPGLVEAHYHLGLMHLRLLKLDAASREFLACLELNPRHALAHLNLGAVLVARKEFDRAAGHFAEALRLQPKLIRARKNLEALKTLEAQRLQATKP